ncbi:MAG: TetR family transcriptional regulator [Actinomycetota bacterium]|nr:TetR family transcriptional regulator [Actinomycetota bacterium]
MARIAEGRRAAEPSSPDQHARQLRILQAAEQLGSESDLDHVQMHEVAKMAGVAIGTLYRYFPSKTHLFVGVMAYQTTRMGHALAERAPTSADPAEQVFDVLVRANRALLSRPHLTNTMMQSATVANAATVTDVATIDNTMRDLLLTVAGIDRPTEEDLAVMRVLLQAWGGILQSSLNGRLSMADAEGDLRLACSMMIARTSAADLRPRDAANGVPVRD